MNLLEGQKPNEMNKASLTYWTDWADDIVDSGVFVEMGPKEGTLSEDTQKRIEEAQKKSAEQGIPFHREWRVLPGYEPRPATKLAHEWLIYDLKNLHWAKG